MLKFRDAVTRSKELLEEVQPFTSSTLQLEEAELTDDERYWQITFSYFTPRDEFERATEALGPVSLFRKHTMIKLRATDGELFGVRNLAA